MYDGAVEPLLIRDRTPARARAPFLASPFTQPTSMFSIGKRPLPRCMFENDNDNISSKPISRKAQFEEVALIPESQRMLGTRVASIFRGLNFPFVLSTLAGSSFLAASAVRFRLELVRKVFQFTTYVLIQSIFRTYHDLTFLYTPLIRESRLLPSSSILSPLDLTNAMPMAPADDGERRRHDINRECRRVSYWRIVWRDYASIAVVAASSLWVYLLPMYLLDHRVVPVSRSNSQHDMEEHGPTYGGPSELSYPWIREPIPTWACGVVVVLVPLLVITLFQLKLRSLWDFHAGLTGTLKATVSSYVQDGLCSRVRIYVLTGCRTMIATIFKHFIGGFRPHYMQVCKPDMTKISGGAGQLQSFFDSSACTANSHDVNRA